VADGRISDLKEGFPDNAGNNEASSRSITLDNVVGNYLILDLGQGRFALYAHLQPGSLRVKLGDRVKTGQVLARLGNSGKSDAPHLHFQLMDANSPSGQAWSPNNEGTPVVHRRELPVNNAVVTFP
jgi:murein DD-endopeptidase MepM/ murein hydrolase activator NlpD